MGEGDPKVQISSYKISHVNVTYSMVIIVNNIALYIRKLLREQALKEKPYSSQEKEFNYVW